MKIGYLGPDGTFSQQAALWYQKSLAQESTLLQYNNIYAALEGVMKCEIEECVVPLENSIEGTVTSTIDFLIFTSDIYITQELVIAVREDFLVRQDYNGQAITKILSHPQALSQCSEFLRKYFPNVCKLQILQQRQQKWYQKAKNILQAFLLNKQQKCII